MSLVRIGWVLLLFTQVYGASLPGKYSKKHEELLSKLSNYRLVRPFRSTSEGVFVSHDLTTAHEEEHLEYKRVKRAHNQRRRRRSVDAGGNGDEYSEDMDQPHGSLFHFVLEGMNGEHLMLNVERNKELFSPSFAVERYLENGTLVKEHPNTRCYYLGHVSHKPNSSVAISNCAGMSGWISTGDEEYIIEPVEVEHPPVTSNFTYDGVHILYRSSDHAGPENPKLEIPETLVDTHGLKDDTMSWTDQGSGDSEEEEAHQRQRRQASRVYTTDSPHFVETMIAADSSMHEFHGSGLTLYLTTMINIVNKAYAHESLGVNIKFVIVRIILLNKDQSRNLVVEGDAARSLTNVCRWASASTTPDDNAPEHHDFAAFVTKRSFGPAGFAPVTGMCAISRSCSLNRDEGLLTSFVVAHEAGHVLGMEHDSAQNACELQDGAIMAAVVTATYNKYFWSSCSKREVLRQLPNLYCLRDTPFNTTEDMPFPGIRYTMNDQCRFDFGPGTITCNGQYNIDACKNLWCLQPDSVPVRTCRSKKGPPLDGSSCGPGMWCIQGRCVDIENRQHGAWGEWQKWSDCTYNCGTGVQTRIRHCDNPPPVNGGRDCEGKSLEYKLCNTKPCKKNKDRRAMQCQDNLGNWVYHGATHQWMPFQNRNRTQQCKLTCMSENSGDVVVSTYNVTDGTSCNYEDKDSICIQGECVNVGCDRRLNSTLATDICGVCGGNNTSCKQIKGAKRQMPKQAKQYKKEGEIPSKERKYVKIIRIPAGATNVKVEEVRPSPYFIALKETVNGRYILNGARKQSKAHDFIDQGIRYIYRPNNMETLVTAGPLPVDIQLRVFVNAKISLIHLRWSYYIQSEETQAVGTPHLRSSQQDTNEAPRSVTEDIPETPEYPNTPEGFLWKSTGWTECTVSCGGGISYYQYQCERTRDNATVNPRRCNQKGYDPQAISKPCNEEECLPDKPPPVYEWRTSDWGPCSRTCGAPGTKSRTLGCQEVRYNEDGSLFERGTNVTLGYCPEHDRPAEVAECQGRACSAEWETGSWSGCSVTCGSGIQTRTVSCDKPEGREDEFRCFASKPPSKRSCDTNPCPAVVGCQPSNPQICKPKNYLKYCTVSGYEDFCCATCEEQKAKLAAGKEKSKKKKKKSRANQGGNVLEELITFTPRNSTVSPTTISGETADGHAN